METAVQIPQVQIGSLFNRLASFEANRGQIKRLETENSTIRAEFVSLAGNGDSDHASDADFVSESGQKCASLRFQSRGTLSREMLVDAGISAAVLDACTVQTSFAVLRVH